MHSTVFFAMPVGHMMQNHIKSLPWQVETIDINGSFTFTNNEKISSVETGKLIVPSSGSTGEPKAIALGGDRLWASAKAFIHYHHIDSANTGLRFWNYLPMSYLGGLFNLTLIPLAAGGSIFIDSTFNGKTFLGFWAAIERYKIDSLWLVPSVLRGLLTLA